MSASFWSDAPERHQRIARTFYENIEHKHPPSITSRGASESSHIEVDLFGYCDWSNTAIEYPEYTGPRVVTL